MSHWWTGLLAAGAAWVINRFVVKHLGEIAIIGVIPWLEEILKTGIALFSGGSLLFTHGVFGFIEFLYDYFTAARWGALAGLFSMLIHWFYGLVTLFVYKQTSSWLGGILCAGFFHVFWNYTMVMISRKN
jgi:hypothetical protein